MTLKQQLFVQAYLANGGNGTEAARSAGYTGDDATLAVTAARTLRNAKVAAAVGQRVARASMAADEVLQLLTEQARATMDDFVSEIDIKHRRQGDDGSVEEWEEKALRLDWKKAKRRKKAHLIQVLKYDKQGNPEIRLYSAQAALIQLGKYHGLFTDSVAVQGHVADWAAGFAQDAAGVLREFITDDDDLARALDALKSRLQARLDGGRPDGAGPVRGEAEVSEPTRLG